MGAFKRIHPLPPAAPPPLCSEVAVRSMLFAIHACVNGPSSSLCRSIKKKGLPCGAALAHWPLLDSNRVGAHTTMCAGGVPVLLSILVLLLLLTSAPEGVEMFMRLGGCVSFWLPMNRLYFVRRLFVSRLPKGPLVLDPRRILTSSVCVRWRCVVMEVECGMVRICGLQAVRTAQAYGLRGGSGACGWRCWSRWSHVSSRH